MGDFFAFTGDATGDGGDNTLICGLVGDDRGTGDNFAVNGTASGDEEHVLALERAGADDYRYLVHATRAQRIDDVGSFVGEHPARAAEQCV